MKPNHIITLTVALILSILLFVEFAIPSKTPEPTIAWEGLVKDLNFRDVGESLNTCLGATVFQTKKFFRSNRYFSGWSCDNIGNPDRIYSLNFDPQKNKLSFCRKDDGSKLVGAFSNRDFIISDIEFLEKWDDPLFRETLCSTFRSVLSDFNDNRKSLVHCDVGRDRTGTFVAMIAASTFEQSQPLSDNVISAIECDYEKTKKLEVHKRGRMKEFLEKVRAQGGVAHFLAKQCQIPPTEFQSAARAFLKSQF